MKMNHKRLIPLTVCCILAVVLGLPVQSFAGNESETNAKAERHLEKANELRKLADHDGAIAEYEKVISLSPNSDIALNAQYWIGQSHFKAGQLDAALAAFQTLLDEHPTNKVVASTKRMTQRVQKAKKEKTLVEAVENGDVEQLKLLISKGADVDAKVKAEVVRSDGDAFYVEGWTLLHLAAMEGHADIAAILINKGADIHARNEDWFGATPLLCAARLGHADVAELLIDAGADINMHAKYFQTPLDYAASQGHLDVVELLISKGADPARRGALHGAARKDHLDVVELLISKGANIEARGSEGDTPLHVAVKSGNLEMVKLLLKRGAYIDNRDYSDVTPLIQAIQKGNQDMVELLLANGAAPWRRRMGSNLVGIAMLVDQKEMVRFLVDKGFEHSAVHVAAFFGDLDEVKSYLAAGGDINAQDPSLLTLLNCATGGGHAAVARFLINKGANINLQGHHGWTPLHWAAVRGYTEIVRILLDKGADITSRDMLGLTPLYWAAHGGRRDIVEMLLAKGADVNAKSGFFFEGGKNQSEGHLIPLHAACKFGHSAVVEVLIANGSDVNAKTKNGETPMSLAKEGRFRDYEQVIELLRKHGAKE
jgi:cytohesin